MLANSANLIMDLGGIVFTWDDINHDPAERHLKNLRDVWTHPIFHEFEAGRISESCAYTQLSSELGVSSGALKRAVYRAFDTMAVSGSAVEFLEQFRRGGGKIVCLSNSPPAFTWRTLDNFDIWHLFDKIYMTGLLGLRKPDDRVYRYVTEDSGFDAESVIVIDDSPENIESAKRCGMKTFLFTQGCDLAHLLAATSGAITAPLRATEARGPRSFTLEAKEREGAAHSYLLRKLEQQDLCASYIGHGTDMVGAERFFGEVFSTIVVLDTYKGLSTELRDRLTRRLLKMSRDGLFCFFTGGESEYLDVGKIHFPCDVDTTSLASNVLLDAGLMGRGEVNRVAREILSNVNADNVIQVYFDEDRARVDPVVCLNALRFLHRAGVAGGAAVVSTKEYVRRFLESGEFHKGTRYYRSPDVFLFALSTFIVESPQDSHWFMRKLRAAVAERAGCSPHPIERAMRLMSCERLGIANRVDLVGLLESQLTDGGWVMNSLFSAGKMDRSFGSRELTTAFALEALARSRPGGRARALPVELAPAPKPKILDGE